MKKNNLSWVGALLVFGLLLWCTSATPGKIADPSTYTCAVYSTALSLLPPVVAIVLALNTKEVYTSLLVGIATGALLYANGNLELALTTLFFNEDGGMVSKLWPVGLHPYPHPGRVTVCHPAAGGHDLCGRLLQLPDRRLGHAPGHRPSESLPRQAGLPD